MLTFRTLLDKVIKYSRQVLRDVHIAKIGDGNIFQKEVLKSSEFFTKVNTFGGNAEVGGGNAAIPYSSTSRSLLKLIRPMTARFVQGFITKVSSPLWFEARRRVTKRLIFGETAPFFALVGVTLVSGAQQGLVTKNDEIDALCGKIKLAILRAGLLDLNSENDDLTNLKSFNADDLSAHVFSTSDLKFGPLIEKGCNAAVYAATWDSKKNDELPSTSVTSPLKNNSEGSEYGTSKVAGLNKSSQEVYPLAVKMLFNYEIESYAPSIINAMYKELIPAKRVQLDRVHKQWQERFFGGRISLPAHPNIVYMPCVFVDYVPLLEHSMNAYPLALPVRLNPSGYGRNMSLFCVMKRYDMTLEQYLSSYKPTPRIQLLLLTQILEAVLHINLNGIVHRDLKLDNILISIEEGWENPFLVLSDFGCCAIFNNQNFRISFSSYEADPRQGNAALMAPEVKTAVPGIFQCVNYSHSDLWSVGALAYNIFGQCNPFLYHEASSKCLDSADYKESQLPKLSKEIPAPIRVLIHDFLRRNSSNRPSPKIAATLCQLVLWAPKKWLNRHALTLPSHNEIVEWLLCLTTKVLCEYGISQNPCHPTKKLEYQLVSTFLSRTCYSDIVDAVRWNRAF